MTNVERFEKRKNTLKITFWGRKIDSYTAYTDKRSPHVNLLYKCEDHPELDYIIDASDRAYFNIDKLAVCRECGKQLEKVEDEANFKPIRLCLRGLNDQDPFLDMQRVYASRDEVDKHGYERRWHEK